MGIKQEIGRR